MSPAARRIWTACLSLGIAAGAAIRVVEVIEGLPTVAVDIVIGGTYLVAGLVIWRRRPDGAVGPLLTAAAFGWLIAANRHPALFSVSVALEGVDLPLLFHAILAYPWGRIQRRDEKVVVKAMYAAFAVRAVSLFLTAEPQECRDCFAIGPLPNVRIEEWADRMTSVAGGMIAVAVIVLIVRRFARSTPARRLALIELWIAGVGLAIFLAFVTATYATGGDASQTHFNVGFAARLSIPTALAVGVFRLQLTRAAVGGLVVDLDPRGSPADLRAALARALHDPQLEVVYWVPDRDCFVDLEGRPVALPDAGGELAVTMIERDGKQLAALIHDAALLGQPDLVQSASAATALALENARLTAEVKLQLEEVRASRARIVEAADAARLGIERDLHDGAQQRLLALAMTLREARRRLGDETSPAHESLSGAVDELGAALSELRELARGVYPAVLTDSGLEAALESLADRSQIPTTVNITLERRLLPRIEATAYFVVSEALANVAKYSGASHARVTARANGSALVLEITDDGVGGADPARGSGLRGLDDRVAAVGGRMRVESPLGRGTRIVAEIPCG
ncbi:MAG: histidine kinase [Actinomycetota bacterium]